MDEKEKVIKKLQSTIFAIAAFHCTDGHPETETCIYCGTEWPCSTVRMARKSATLWSFD
jgi:hypothetical protein